jgi:hypothetical protein
MQTSNNGKMLRIRDIYGLTDWFVSQPPGWSLSVSYRSLLRAFPTAFSGNLPDQKFDVASIWIFRSTFISWLGCVSNNKIDDTASSAFEIFRKIELMHEQNKYNFNYNIFASAAFSIITNKLSDLSSQSANAAWSFESAYKANRSAIIIKKHRSEHRFWREMEVDCRWLSEHAKKTDAHCILANRKAWPRAPHSQWHDMWSDATIRLLTLDPSYQVWIDWYNRRIEGHDAAFDIPGDKNRIHDKAILARLADATDEDFWGKGATYVNTTLQSWIDEARLTAELESFVRKLEAGAATRFGSPEERDARAALRAKLDAALPPAHAPIGHNHPPEGIDPAEAPILPPAIREEAKVMLVTLDQTSPDALAVAKTLTRWSKVKSTYQHDEFSKNFSGELGTSAARWITRILAALCLLGLAWLKTVLGI